MSSLFLAQSISEFIDSRRDFRGSPLVTGDAEIRAFFTQEKNDHGGNRTHAYHAQKRTIYQLRYIVTND